jgi:thiamine-monophosphate kinase
MKEFDFINVVKQFPRAHSVPQGIGDDCAVITEGDLLICTDTIVQGTHFDTDDFPEDIGRKALAVSLSDIAAMGGTAKYFLLNVSIPRGMGSELVTGMIAGMRALAQKFRVDLIGGDTTSGEVLSLTTTVIGLPHSRGPVYRKGARPGDMIFVTGPLGASYPSKRHLRFEPRLHFGKALLDLIAVNAMIDLSDGLASDLRHILEMSQVGATLEREAIPFAPELIRLPTEEALRHALSDGEDFELCFATSREEGLLLQRVGTIGGLKPILIGTCTEDHGLRWSDLTKIDEGGYEHEF